MMSASHLFVASFIYSEVSLHDDDEDNIIL